MSHYHLVLRCSSIALAWVLLTAMPSWAAQPPVKSSITYQRPSGNRTNIITNRRTRIRSKKSLGQGLKVLPIAQIRISSLAWFARRRARSSIIYQHPLENHRVLGTNRGTRGRARQR
jgi:hypothetical protein